MYYAPVRSPKKLGMPVLGYFVVVGTALTALLFAADATMVKPAKLSVASNFYGLPPEYRGEPGTPRRAEPEPPIASFALAAETTGAAPAAEPQHTAAAPQVAKPKPPQRKVVVHKRQPRQDEDDWFGNNNRREYANSRDPFSSNYRERDSFSNSNYREREPSWRDTWASGSFDQQRERGSRRASRQNNDFWFR
jgi:hypothetical protein